MPLAADERAAAERHENRRCPSGEMNSSTRSLTQFIGAVALKTARRLKSAVFNPNTPSLI
jgi:hypothetical protein